MTTSINNAFELSFRLHGQRHEVSSAPSKPDHPSTLKSIPITLNPHHLVHPNEPPISDLLYSGFLEHLGRCIYGGIVDDHRDPSPAQLLEKQDEKFPGRLGFRKDVKALIAKDGDLEIPMLRWPGGNFVSNYHWQDAIGPIKDRPKRTELAWLSSDPNFFGTDEYIDYCRATGCEPYICLNMGTGTLEEALAWVEYCNGTGDSHWANLRRKNCGRDEPHNVKWWGLGNEMWGPWQVGHLNAKDYTARAKSWAHGLKLVDPTIKLVSCGQTGASEWDREVVATMVGFADLHSIHFYTVGEHGATAPKDFKYEQNVFGPAAAEMYINTCNSLIDMANTERALLQIKPQKMRICFDEWNVWDEKKGHAQNGLEQWYDYSDMLGFVAWLHVLLRKHKEVEIACLAQTVNVISPLMTKPDGVCKQTTYYPLRLFSKYMKDGSLLSIPNQIDLYTGPTWPTHIQDMDLKPAYIDTVAITTPTSIRLSVLNRHPTADWTAQCDTANLDIDKVEVHEMYSDDLHALNTFEDPERVVPVSQTYSVTEWQQRGQSVNVRQHSWSLIMLHGT